MNNDHEIIFNLVIKTERTYSVVFDITDNALHYTLHHKTDWYTCSTDDHIHACSNHKGCYLYFFQELNVKL